jgi:pimeloyl-ACP methyl ester carboxylesterase
MKSLLFYLTLIIFPVFLEAQFREETLAIKAGDDSLRGSVIVPDSVKQFPLFILQAGSGPTDRNGNNPLGVSANSYRLLAIELAKHHIGSLLFDKRGIAASRHAMTKESDLLFDSYVNDLISWIEKARSDKRVQKIIVAGHSEGSLIAMLAAARSKTDGYISIAGPASSIDAVIKTQMAGQPEKIRVQVDSLFTLLQQDKKIDSVPPYLLSLFRPGIQPFMKSWMKYTPCEEIKKLKVPVLIIQGTTDLQVNEEEGKALARCRLGAAFELITGMNHVLKNSSADRGENLATYRNLLMPVNEVLVKAVAAFVNKINK